MQKNGANPFGAADLVHASPSGERLAYLSSAPFPGAQGAESLPTYLSSREAGGWSTVGLLPAQSTPTPNQSAVIGWSEDLSEVLVSTNSVEHPDTYGIFLRDSETGALQPIASGGAGGDSYAFDSATPDDASFVFEDRAEEPLAGGAKDADNVYQWSGGQLSLIGQLPDGSTPTEGSFAGPYDWQTSDPGVGGGLDHLYTEHVISSDGSRVFFTLAGSGQLYVRESNAVSVPVSASQKTNGSGPGGIDPAGPRPAAFMGATPEGEEVFFTSAEELTNDADTGSADQGDDLYGYEVGTGHLTDLSVDANPSDSSGASVEGVLGISEDGSYVYFVASGDLTGEEENADGAEAESGRPNLYLWHGGATTFIATLSGAQHPGEVDSMDWAPSATAGIEKNSRVTPDGKTLLFASELSLNGYASNGYTEFYRYSAPSAQLSCVSCDPGGEAALGDAYLQGPPPSSSPPIAHQSSLTHNLSSDGERVFFVSPDPLVPQDTNGQPDVYEWEADGSGSCQIAAGCLDLISTGQSPEPSYLADASATGNDVFFSPLNSWSDKTRTVRSMSMTPGLGAASRLRIRLPKLRV